MEQGVYRSSQQAGSWHDPDVSKQDLLDNLTSRSAVIQNTQIFNLKLSNEVKPVTNQSSSGLCWLFATTNCARLVFAKQYNVEDFQFSQSYLFFWDKLEKANYYLENMIELVEEPLDSRIVQHLNQKPENDGGQWDMAANLLQKYGLVPKTLFPESWHSSNSKKLNSLLTSKLREFSLELRAIYNKTLQTVPVNTLKSELERKALAVAACRSYKTEQMSEIYTILAMMSESHLGPTRRLRSNSTTRTRSFSRSAKHPPRSMRAFGPSSKLRKASRSSMIRGMRQAVHRAKVGQCLGSKTRAVC